VPPLEERTGLGLAPTGLSCEGLVAFDERPGAVRGGSGPKTVDTFNAWLQYQS